jgi:hypothetical protein
VSQDIVLGERTSGTVKTTELALQFDYFPNDEEEYLQIVDVINDVGETDKWETRNDHEFVQYTYKGVRIWHYIYTFHLDRPIVPSCKTHIVKVCPDDTEEEKTKKLNHTRDFIKKWWNVEV